ncbi:purine-nucleoside phosphorylase [Clostridium amylolyticum]|uniref:Purine nucleoside phosphorylase DeoD-type n=1 Tax=Clostridium amylolyticum TaxID=1121298 RepID=A0A1M6I6H6_9CLOT|nr:purine-nucleoside phosphorylase [Clostridium amylolyticum]SHJ30059.1 purine-nucleoside phosphorylase [Clostridium amylolyticum]
MSTHIGAKPGDIAESILLPGDPLRAKFIAEKYLENCTCYNEVRGMLGFTGYYKGKRVSVQGTGMGIPSISIYVNELIKFYGVKNLIRVGTCGSINKDIKVRDTLLALSASTNSGVNKMRFNGMDYAPTASFDLIHKAYSKAQEMGIDIKGGSVLTSDLFYNDNAEDWKLWAKYGVMGIEMETAELYTNAAREGAKALSILTVSDSLITQEETTAEERQLTFLKMIELALEVAE